MLAKIADAPGEAEAPNRALVPLTLPAARVASAAQAASVQRRFYWFFQFVRLDGTHSARVVVELLGLSGKPLVLTIDRTMPLPTAGNSNTAEHAELLDRLCAAPGPEDRGADGRQ